MLKELKKCVISEKKDPEIFDIVIYGSAVKGEKNINDVDLAVIFHKGTLKDRLNKLQLLKKEFNIDKKIDIKGYF